MDLIAEFDAVLAPLVSDRRFRRWGGLVLTSCLLGRHVWTVTRAGQPLYPHLFVMLVAASGFGKSTVIDSVGTALKEFTEAPAQGVGVARVKLAAKSITLPRMLRELGGVFPDAKKLTGLRSTCYAALLGEISLLLGDKASTVDLQTLAAIWDMNEVLEKQNVYAQMKGKETKAVDHYTVLFTGAQPDWIAEAMPVGKFRLGFPARTHFVLGAVPTDEPLSQDDPDEFGENLRRVLGPTMQAVAALKGRMRFEPDAFAELQAWRKSQHGVSFGLLDGYGTRRPEHLAKLALVVACARVHATIEQDDLLEALDTLQDAERLLPEVLAQVGANSQRPREDQVVEWVRERGETRESVLRAYMRNFFETHRISQTLEELRAAGLLKCTTPDQVSPHRKFKAG